MYHDLLHGTMDLNHHHELTIPSSKRIRSSYNESTAYDIYPI